MPRVDEVLREAANPNFLKDLSTQSFMPNGSRPLGDSIMLNGNVMLGKALNDQEWRQLEDDIKRYSKQRGVPVIVKKLGPALIELQWG